MIEDRRTRSATSGAPRHTTWLSRATLAAIAWALCGCTARMPRPAPIGNEPQAVAPRPLTAPRPLALVLSGDTGAAVRASSAVPGVVAPVLLGDGLYVDGGLISPPPAATARAMGATIVIAIDVVYPPGDSVISGPLSVLFQTTRLTAAPKHAALRR